MKVDPIKPTLKAHGTLIWKLEYDELLSSFAFKFNLRRYTVVVYDPDPNPKNEEQAVARSHRIGQKREVRVLHLEAVCDDLGAAVGPYNGQPTLL